MNIARELQIDTADELLTTELMFNGMYNSMDVHQLVALVSCLIPSDKSQVRARPVKHYPPCKCLHRARFANGNASELSISVQRTRA